MLSEIDFTLLQQRIDLERGAVISSALAGDLWGMAESTSNAIALVQVILADLYASAGGGLTPEQVLQGFLKAASSPTPVPDWD